MRQRQPALARFPQSTLPLRWNRIEWEVSLRIAPSGGLAKNGEQGNVQHTQLAHQLFS